MRKNRTLALLILALFLATAFTIHFTKVKASMTQPTTIAPNYDGFITQESGPIYSRDTDGAFIRTYGGPSVTNYTGFVKFNISGIPDNATISHIEYRIYIAVGTNGSMRLRDLKHDPESASNQTAFEDCKNGTIYYTYPDLDSANWYNITLSESASTDLENNLALDWFAIGSDYLVSTQVQYGSMEQGAGLKPEIIVHYAYTNYQYTFYGLYGENGTHLNSINITAYASDGSNVFEVDGSRIVGFDRRQSMFSFDLDASTQRVFYVTANNETFYLFQPETPYETYGITIYDYTGKLGEGATYLEAYRTVNATEYLVERRIIFDSFNEVPLTLAEGKIYRLQILWNDNTTYDWGYFTPGVDTTPTLVLSKLSFSQKAQMTYKYLSIEATRQNATWIRVNYQDNTPAEYETDWCNITITYRNGTLVTTYNSTAETLSWDWYSADNETDYWVLVEIDQTFWDVILEYSKLLDADDSYSTFPDLGILGTLGGLNTANTLSAVIVLCVFGVGSRKNVDVALIAGFSVAGMLRYMGANTWSWNLLAFGFALSIAYAVYKGRVSP